VGQGAGGPRLRAGAASPADGRFQQAPVVVAVLSGLQLPADLNYRYDGTVANFSIISRRVADTINGMGEAVRFYGGFLTWTGFAKAYVDVKHVRRLGSESATPSSS